MRRLAVLLLLPTSLHALCCQPNLTPCLKPWFGEVFLLQCDLGAAWCRSPTVSSPDPELHRPINARPIWMRCQMSPYPRFDAQVEIGGNDTTFHKTYFDYGSFTARYMLYTEDLGDPLQLTAGFTVTVPTKAAVKDIAAEHLGYVEGALHAAVGHEIRRCDRPVWQMWAVGACAVSGQGSPQFRGRLGVSRCFRRCQWLTVLFQGLLGLGRDALLLDGFNGYGRIRTRTLDVCAKYSMHWTGYYGATLCYAYRIFAKNYPERRHCFGFYVTLPLFP